MTEKGLSLSVADLLRKTSPQVLDTMNLNSKLVDMFQNGLSEVQEDKLLDFLPLQTSRYRDLTDLDLAKEEARAYIRAQFESYQKAKLAAEQRRRAAYVQRVQQHQQQQQASGESLSPSAPPKGENVESAPGLASRVL